MGQNKNNFILDKLSLLFLISVSFFVCQHMSLLLMFKFPITNNKFSYSNLWSFQDEHGAPRHQLNLVSMTSWLFIFLFIFIFFQALILDLFFGTNCASQFLMVHIFWQHSGQTFSKRTETNCNFLRSKVNLGTLPSFAFTGAPKKNVAPMSAWSNLRERRPLSQQSLPSGLGTSLNDWFGVEGMGRCFMKLGVC